MFRTIKMTALLALAAGLPLATLSNVAQAQFHSSKTSDAPSSIQRNENRGSVHARPVIDVAAQPPVLGAATTTAGRVTGRLCDDNGVAVANQNVILQRNDLEATQVQTRTDEAGRFALPIERGGVYLLKAVDQVAVCRVWAANQAPPIAIRSVQLVTSATAGQTIVRGQSFATGSGGLGGALGGGGFTSNGFGTGVGNGSFGNASFGNASFGNAGGGNVGFGGGATPSADSSNNYGYGQSTLGGFQNCDTACGEPELLSNCPTGGTCGCGGKCGCGGECCGGCGCGGGGGWLSTAGGRSKLLVAVLGGAIIGVAIDQDDDPDAS